MYICSVLRLRPEPDQNVHLGPGHRQQHGGGVQELRFGNCGQLLGEGKTVESVTPPSYATDPAWQRDMMG